MLCALLGISIMRGVTITEELFRKSGVPIWLRPGIGGLAIGSSGPGDAGYLVVRAWGARNIF